MMMAYARFLEKLLKGVTLILLTLCSSRLSAQQKPLVYPIGSTEIDAPVDWVANVFSDKLKEVEMVGLGEVSHGSADIFKLKGKLVQYLVEREGYQTLLLEIDDATLRPLDAYLHGNNSAASMQVIDSLFSNQFNRTDGGLALNNTSFKNLFYWLKSYNLAHPSGRVSLRGVDIFVSFNYIKKQYMDTISVKWMHDTYGINDLNTDDAIKLVHAWYSKFGADMESRLSPGEQKNLKIDIEDFKTTMTYYNGGQDKNRYMITLRDSIMSVNTTRLKDGKAMLWAHNMHIANNDFVKGLFKAKMLGHFLKEKYNNKYFVILTDFSDHAVINVKQGNGLFKPRNYSSNKISLVSQLFHKLNISSGVVFPADLANLGLPYGYNNIGLEGDDNFLEGPATGFDALLFLKDINSTQIIR